MFVGGNFCGSYNQPPDKINLGKTQEARFAYISQQRIPILDELVVSII